MTYIGRIGLTTVGLGALVLCTCLVSCGGATLAGTNGSGGVGSGGTGVYSGSVTGLASIIMDGTEMTDASGRLGEFSDQPGTTPIPQSQLMLGDQLRLSVSQGQVTSQQVQAQVAGVVQAIGATTLQVAGMRIVVSTSSTSGPVTFFTGVQNQQGLSVGDDLEIFGFYAEDATGPYLQATRIVEHATGDQIITGVASAISQVALRIQGQNFQVATTATGVDATLSGKVVSVWVDPATQQVVQILPLGLTGNAATVQLSGLVYGQTSQGFWLNGTQIQAQAALLGGLTTAEYVTVTGALQQGVVTASSIQPVSSAATTVRLSGSVTQYVSNASMVVRGVTVNASNAQTQGTLENGAFVVIQGVISGNQVQATSVQVTTPPVQAVLTLDCQTTQLQGTTLLCTDSQGVSQTVQWSSDVFLSDAQGEAAMNMMKVGQPMEINGLLQPSGVINATSLRILGVPLASPMMGGGGESALVTRGVVYNYDPATGNFNINNLLFNTSTAAVKPGGVMNGVTLEVQFRPGGENQLLSVMQDH